MRHSLLICTSLSFVIILNKLTIVQTSNEAKEMNNNLSAFLTLIRKGEGTLGVNGYRTLYGGGLFGSFDDHPRTIVKAGAYSSSAAGAYQILQKTWDGLVKANPWALPDFSPESQDKAAVFLIKGRGAYDDVIDGRFKTAIKKCNREWASLPGSPYGQPTLTMAKALKVIADAGGISTETETPKEKPVNPLIIPVAIELAKQLPAFGKIFQNKDVSERNIEAVTKAVDVVVNSVGAVNGQQALESIKADPVVLAVANDAVKASTADLLDAYERFNAIDQANIKAAREFNTQEPNMINLRWLKAKFWHILATIVVVSALAAMGYIIVTSKDVAERTMVLQVLLLGGFAAVMSFVFGSSTGSKFKDITRDK